MLSGSYFRHSYFCSDVVFLTVIFLITSLLPKLNRLDGNRKFQEAGNKHPRRCCERHCIIAIVHEYTENIYDVG